jgi:hypothetical protein
MSLRENFNHLYHTYSKLTMDEELPSLHCVTDIEFGVTIDSSVTVRCNGARFYVTTSLENLGGISDARSQQDKLSLGSHYMQVLDGLQNYEDNTSTNVESFEDWVLEPCIPHFKSLTSARQSSRPLTLEEYFNPATFVLKLVNIDGHLMAERCPHDPTATAHLTSKISPSSPEVHESIPRIMASSVDILPDSRPLYDVGSDPPKKVQLQDGTQLFFKEALDRGSFLREIESLFQIDKTGLTKKLRVPKLQYIVTSSDGSSIIGMLLDYIDHSLETLRPALSGSSLDSRKKRMGQIREIVDHLHGIGVVWGDVKPENILIDKEGDAWIIDFGGGYSPDWVDSEKSDSLSGDLQGISRLEKFLNIS